LIFFDVVFIIFIFIKLLIQASRCLSPTAMKRIKDQIDVERKALLEKQNLAEDEKDKVERELEKREKELTRAQ